MLNRPSRRPMFALGAVANTVIALNAPVLSSLTPASDRGASSTDNYTNQQYPGLMFTLPFTTAAGNRVRIYDNGVIYAFKDLTVDEAAGGPIAFTGLSPLGAGVHNFTMTVDNGQESNVSNVLTFTIDFATIGRPVLSGTTPTANTTPAITVTHVVPKPLTGDILVLMKAGVAIDTFTLGSGDLNSIVVSPSVPVPLGPNSFTAYIYRPGNAGFSLDSAAYVITISSPSGSLDLKYWDQGLPYVGLGSPTLSGAGTKYWDRGLPAPFIR